MKDKKPTMLSIRQVAQTGLLPVYTNLKLGQLAHRKLGQYQYN